MDCLYLCQSGVPFDVAFSLPNEERLAWVIALGTLAGRTFNFATMEWKEIA